MYPAERASQSTRAQLPPPRPLYPPRERGGRWGGWTGRMRTLVSAWIWLLYSLRTFASSAWSATSAAARLSCRAHSTALISLSRPATPCEALALLARRAAHTCVGSCGVHARPGRHGTKGMAHLLPCGRLGLGRRCHRRLIQLLPLCLQGCFLLLQPLLLLKHPRLRPFEVCSSASWKQGTAVTRNTTNAHAWLEHAHGLVRTLFACSKAEPRDK